MRKTFSLRFLWRFFPLALLWSAALSAQDVAAPLSEMALQTPTVLAPVPEKYSDKNRMFQGIPSLAVTNDRNVWAVWYTGGTTECAENYILVVRSRDGGATWSEPIFAVDMEGPVRLYDPSMWQDPEGKLWVFWAQGWTWWDGRAGVWAMTSKNPNDDTPAWSEPFRICDGIMMGKPFVDSRGAWHLPVSIWNVPTSVGIPQGAFFPVEGRSGAKCWTSVDQGKTWRCSGSAFVPREIAVFDEHSIVEKKDGTFWALVRTKGIGEAFSSDGGVTWTECKPCENLRHTSARFFLRRLASGNLILVKHGKPMEDCGRSRLTAYISRDDGATWEGGLLLDERNGVSYPDGDQTPDGTIFVVYDFGRTGAKEILAARFSEEDILAAKIISPHGALRILVNKAHGSAPPPTPLKFTPNPNSDGASPRTDDPRAAFRPSQSDELATLENGVKLFLNRDYRAQNLPEFLQGKTFVRGNIDGIRASCTTSGTAFVYTPLPARNKHSAVETLESQGWSKVALPEILLFGNVPGNIVTLYQKECHAGEMVEFSWWGVLIF